MFTERAKGISIIFVANHTSNGHKNTIENGDSVILKIDQERVFVHELTTLPDGLYQGNINGFEPSYETEFRGLILGQAIRFSEKHIHGCNYIQTYIE